MKKIFTLFLSVVLLVLSAKTWGQDQITGNVLLNSKVFQYEKAEFDINIKSSFTNPYDAKEIALDMMITTPSGNSIVLPCFYNSGTSDASGWKARFTPQENGNYSYYFRLSKNAAAVANTTSAVLVVAPSAKNGFLHKNDNWTFRFDSGKPFRGIGENIGWESRTWEDKKFNYENLLGALAANGGNFFRTWMSAWNLPLEWKKVVDTDRYSNSTQYFNEGAIKRMDELVEMIDSLDLYMMLALEYHGGLKGEWASSNYNKVNGGPATTPSEFFTLAASKEKYKNKLRYMVARWGYSPNIAAWEFFNEVDNAAYSDETTIVIPHSAITQWHTEMSAYLTEIDPYNHLITTSISHREITGMFSIADMDFNQKHIYKQTGEIPSVIKSYNTSKNKPFVVGEFGYDWDWNNVNTANGPNFDYDFKRGLWYGIFSPTPVTPMNWWWEFFYDRNMMPYYKSIKRIHDLMMESGKGALESTTISVTGLEAFAVKAGNKHFIYLLNNGSSNFKNTITYNLPSDGAYTVINFHPGDLSFGTENDLTASGGKLQVPDISLSSEKELIIIISPNNDPTRQGPKTGSAHPIPGIIEAEDFDTGGEDVAYHDNETSNTGGQYRTEEAVDIETTTLGGFHISNIVKGEWVEYTVDVAIGGKYIVEAKVSSDSDSNSFYIEIDGEPVTGSIAIPNTGGMQNWEISSVSTSKITSGKKTMRIVMETSGFNLNSLEFTLENKAPLITLISPQKDTTLILPATMEIKASASDDDGAITKVEFYSGNLKIGESTTAPYSSAWNPAAGTHNLFAVAYDDKGVTSTSNSISVVAKVSSEQKPFNSVAFTIPGKIEAEEYDLGASGISYSDKSPGNKFSEFRQDDVDIEKCTDEGAGYNLGDLQIGEWVEYTANISEAGVYDIEFRVATEMENTKFHIEMDGVDITGSIAVPNTGGWQKWQTIRKEGMQLSAGEKTIRLVIEGEYFNLNFMNFIKTSVTGIEDELAKNATIYPNPTQEYVTISDQNDLFSRVEILDIHGKKVLITREIGSQLNISKLKAGVYTLLFFTKQNTVAKTFKIVKI